MREQGAQKSMASITHKWTQRSKGAILTRLRILLAATLAVAAAALITASAFAGSSKVVVFNASFAGTATSKVTGDNVAIAARATGTGTLIGKSKLTGAGKGMKTGDANCVPFSGPGKIVTAKRLKPKSKAFMVLKFVVQPSSSGCAGEDQNQVTVTGNAKFAGGTGMYKKARGIFTFTGYYDRGTGAFSVKFKGSLRV
jgi:hypothetical protein